MSGGLCPACWTRLVGSHGGVCDACYREGEGSDPVPRGRFTRPDGSFDIMAYCRKLDEAANAAVGASPPRSEP